MDLVQLRAIEDLTQQRGFCRSDEVVVPGHGEQRRAPAAESAPDLVEDPVELLELLLAATLREVAGEQHRVHRTALVAHEREVFEEGVQHPRKQARLLRHPDVQVSQV
jgi:hypothetical protein